MTPQEPGQVGNEPPGVRLRRIANLTNGSTALGLLLARRHGVALVPGPHGLRLALGYPRRFPATRNPAVCIGDVVLLRMNEADLARRPRLLDHEARHAAQWSLLVGPVGFLPLYLVGAAWSLLRCGDPAWRNPLEVLAGLADGGYRLPARLARRAAREAGSRLRE